ncbi:probable cyclin-dependent serine/threonine-protein kinase DDB_G0292550 isoform X3 [Pectinophora gossypiella]|uniref:probable cyclin-dependent serine/threonine-protein kinase DDB_G0292550 isoform X3 n=1 Tax=Pectinophora gossypiella TaxID=13191 RepID=UPI00214E3DF6|nr:probable cyclin-dependent serine/threonine-protein kinase DDB_G0292550 isoform X3 [Pectinophora gossypiella]
MPSAYAIVLCSVYKITPTASHAVQWNCVHLNSESKMPCGIPFYRRKGGEKGTSRSISWDWDRFRTGKRHHQESAKSSRSASPSPGREAAPAHADSFRPILRTPPPSRAGPPPSPPVPTHPVAPVSPEPSAPLPLMPCPVCSRTFVPQSLAKHVKICEKMTVKKRKTFDSSRQRREGSRLTAISSNGTDLEQYLPKNFGLPENSPFLEKSPPNTAKVAPKPKASSVKNVIKGSKPMADLQRCPHCNRAFGVRAFERHVEWCADKAKILPAAPAQPPPHIADAKQRLNARTQYKAPPVRNRRSSQSREKSSNSRSASVDSSRGVSPPPPREYEDYKHGRSRASESVSSNDHEEASPHVPVIRTSRNSNNSCGDANVKARQARLARDLSSSRIDDSYDPFASAARQMKELMSSDTNIPKSIQNSCKNPNSTLPILRPAKEKPSLSYLSTTNPKTMKDSLNKTYQKTPTLQRMKSFGSTNNENTTNTFGGRCSSFRINRNDKQKSSQKLNTTFTKSSKENISTTEKNYFNRSNTLNRSFSTYTSAYSTPKPKEKIPKIATSMYHSFQRSTIKQPVKLDKIKRDDEKKEFVNLDSILADDNSSMTDSNYIDPRLINENDNLPINVNTILNNPDIISSMESLLTTENLPAKFESFSSNLKNNNIQSNGVKDSLTKLDKIESNNNIHNKITAPTIVDDLSAHYDKIMSSLEQSIASKTSIRDDDSLCEDFDLEEFMTSFDEEIHKHKETKRTCSSTTRVVKQSELVDSNRTSEFNSVSSSPKIVHSSSNGLLPVNKSNSLTFSSNNIVSESLFPSSVKRSSSLLDSIQKKTVQKADSMKSRHKADQLEQDIMQSLKEFDNLYEPEKKDSNQSNKETRYSSSHNGTTKRESRVKSEKKNKKSEHVSNGNYTPNGKSADSAYSRLVSLNRISPSKLSVCNSKESNGVSPLDQIAGSDSSGCQKDDIRSVSSEEFLAMERSAELDEPLQDNVFTPSKEIENPLINEKRMSSRPSSRRSSTWRPRQELSSSESEASLARREGRESREPVPPPRLSRFCHECGSKFPVDTAKFCIECGVKRLVV